MRSSSAAPCAAARRRSTLSAYERPRSRRRRPRRPAPAARRAPAAQAEHEVGLGQPAGRVVAGDTRVRPAAPDQRLEQLGRRGVEVGARLVEQQQLGVVQHRARDGDALHHPARQRPHGVVGARPQPDGARAARRRARAATPCSRAWKRRFSRAGQLAVEQRLVAEEADPPAHRPASSGSSWPRTRAVPACGRSSVASTRSSVDLPAPLGPKTTSVAPRLERQRDVAQRRRARRSGAPSAASSMAAAATAVLQRARPRGAGRARSRRSARSIAFGLPGKLTISVRAGDARDAAAEHAHRRVLQRLRAHRLGEARAPRAR